MIMLDIKIVTESDDSIELEVTGEDPALLDALSELLQESEGVDYAGFRIDHPLTGKMFLIVRTKPGKIKAREAVRQGVKKLRDFAEELEVQASKI